MRGASSLSGLARFLLATKAFGICLAVDFGRRSAVGTGRAETVGGMIEGQCDHARKPCSKCADLSKSEQFVLASKHDYVDCSIIHLRHHDNGACDWCRTGIALRVSSSRHVFLETKANLRNNCTREEART